jgi:diguanylate cyclase (GGDEF)-like protein
MQQINKISAISNDLIKKDTHILIVDDDKAISDAMSEFFEMLGCESSTATSAEEALRIMKSHNIQTVITDIMLPGMDGLEFTQEIKEKYDADVIVMTGFSEDYSYEEVILKGASDFVFKPIRFEELLLRLKRVLQERKLKEELQRLAITDDLTKLYNSRQFYKDLKHEVERAKRYDHSLSLIMMDIDYFKVYNDKYGHLEGDKALARIGEIIRSCLRKTDSAYRYGGEEFTVILPETSQEEAENVADRIREEVSSHVFLPEEEKKVTITISIGITEYCSNEELTDFVKRSDQAMFASKKKGRNRITTLCAN